MSTGAGIAIAGIWLAVALSAFAMKEWAVALGMLAMIATIAIATTGL
jgi:hypothetical protein